MDWSKIIDIVAPSVISIFRQTTAPTAPTPMAAPTVTVERKPSEAVKEIQDVLNTVLKIEPPLHVDGWLGPQTEKAIHDGIAKLKPYLSML